MNQGSDLVPGTWHETRAVVSGGDATRHLDQLAARNIRVLCITPPVFEEYARKYDRDTVRFQRATMKRLAAERGLEYHDFSDDRQFGGVANFFANPDHLNVLGARQFSEHRLKPLLEGDGD